MARNALPSSNLSAVSSFQHLKNAPTPSGTQTPSHADKAKEATCPDCKSTYKIFTEGARGWNTKPHQVCITCYRARRRKKRQQRSPQFPTPNVQGRRIRAHLPDWWCPGLTVSHRQYSTITSFQRVSGGGPTYWSTRESPSPSRSTSQHNVDTAGPSTPHSPCRGLGHCRYRRSIQLMVTGRFPSPRILSLKTCVPFA